jgi:hypothetical protein
VSVGGPRTSWRIPQTPGHHAVSTSAQSGKCAVFSRRSAATATLTVTCGGPLHVRVDADALDINGGYELCIGEQTDTYAVSVGADPDSHSSVRRHIGLGG